LGLKSSSLDNQTIDKGLFTQVHYHPLAWAVVSSAPGTVRIKHSVVAIFTCIYTPPHRRSFSVCKIRVKNVREIGLHSVVKVLLDLEVGRRGFCGSEASSVLEGSFNPVGHSLAT